MRSGTLPHPLVAGFGEACALALREMDRDRAHVEKLSQRLRDGLTKRVPDIVLNGHSTQRYPGNLNYSFSYVEGESLVMALKEIAVSSNPAPAPGPGPDPDPNPNPH